MVSPPSFGLKLPDTDILPDTLKSTLHRVRAPPTKEGQAVTRERFSIPYVSGHPSRRHVKLTCSLVHDRRPR